MPSSSNSRRAVFAPIPGTRVSSIRVGGNFAFSFAAAGISPVSISASIFSASVLPTPGTFVASPRAASSATETGLSRIAAAAAEYASTRYLTAPSSSYSVPNSSSAAAISAFVMGRN